MSTVSIRRDHQLGLAQARDVAARWSDEARERFGMDCEMTQGESSDTLHFKRPGASGTLVVAADHFALEVQLGFLMSAFAPVVKAEIEKNLDALLLSRGAG